MRIQEDLLLPYANPQPHLLPRTRIKRFTTDCKPLHSANHSHRIIPAHSSTDHTRPVYTKRWFRETVGLYSWMQHEVTGKLPFGFFFSGGVKGGIMIDIRHLFWQYELPTSTRHEAVSMCCGVRLHL